MPKLKLNRIEWISLQRILREADIDTDDIPEPQEAIENGDCFDIEDYGHEFGGVIAAKRILDSCPVCGSEECDDGVAYVGASPIHHSDHPETRAERAMDEGRW